MALEEGTKARLTYVAGTIELRGVRKEALLSMSEQIRYDVRTLTFRAPAMAYAEIVRALVREKIPFEDMAKKYEELQRPLRAHREPRPYQSEAVDAWLKRQSRGVVVLPTGAGKTHVATMAIALKQRATLVIAPTLDLVRQWYDLMRANFACPVGIIGGGDYQLLPLTITTYDSAFIHMENIGNRFGFLVFDECHHLPGPSYTLAARLAIAPFRLGLTATPERTDGRESTMDELIGPIVYRREIVELSGDYLADYETERIVVDLSPEERKEYDAERAIYKAFIDKCGIRMASPNGWSDFIKMSARTEDGRRAMLAYRKQRSLALTAPAKLDYVEFLLHQHRQDRCILFTQDNATAYQIARKFLVPVITHQTKVRERSEILQRLSDGSYNAVVTSKVLNEGVDVPDANVAIIISGSGSVREHVQRLGRVLRKKAGKRAVLYELVTAGTSETFTSDRRREHSAYK